MGRLQGRHLENVDEFWYLGSKACDRRSKRVSKVNQAKTTFDKKQTTTSSSRPTTLGKGKERTDEDMCEAYYSMEARPGYSG